MIRKEINQENRLDGCVVFRLGAVRDISRESSCRVAG